jgi:hypothetical protein
MNSVLSRTQISGISYLTLLMDWILIGKRLSFLTTMHRNFMMTLRQSQTIMGEFIYFLSGLSPFQPSLPKREILEFHTLRFVAQHENVILLGPLGLGKTHIASALAYEAVIQGQHVLFTTAQDLVDRCYAALADGSVKQVLRTLGQLDLLVIDELGCLPMDNTAGNHLFQVFAGAYERQSLIVTSNRPFQEWAREHESPAIRSWPTAPTTGMTAAWRAVVVGETGRIAKQAHWRRWVSTQRRLTVVSPVVMYYVTSRFSLFFS